MREPAVSKQCLGQTLDPNLLLTALRFLRVTLHSFCFRMRGASVVSGGTARSIDA